MSASRDSRRLDARGGHRRPARAVAPADRRRALDLQGGRRPRDLLPRVPALERPRVPRPVEGRPRRQHSPDAAPDGGAGRPLAARRTGLPEGRSRLRRPGGRPERLPGLERIHGSRDPELLFRSDRTSTRETPMNNSLRGGLVTAMTAGALLIFPMSNGRVTRAVSRAARRAIERSEDALRAAAEGILAHGRRVRLHPAGPEHHGQQHHDQRRPPPGRGHHLHGRPRPAARSERPDHRRARWRSTWFSPGGTRDSASTPPIPPDREPEQPGLPSKASLSTQAAADAQKSATRPQRRHLERRRPRPLHLHVRDRPAGRLRQDEHDDARDLRDAQHARRHPGQELLRQRRAGLRAERRPR